MKKAISPAFILLAFAWACGNKAAAPAEPEKPKFELLQKANWIIGKWGFATPEGNLTETWTVKNDSTYTGQTYFMVGTDTVFSEAITLEQRGQELSYVTLMPDQNQGKPVAFKLTSSTQNTLIFENPAHDYPQKITYTQTHPDSLQAEISGTDKGKPANEKFPMGKLY